MKEQGIGHSHAKIILMGEHSVVYGEPAIALPLPDVTLTAIIKLTNKGGHQIKSRYFEGPLNQIPEKMAGVQRLISSLMRRFNGESDQWIMTIKSQLPAERGMGSSAATAVAIVRAFFDLYEERLERKQLLQLADIEEEVTHRSPSGYLCKIIFLLSCHWISSGYLQKFRSGLCCRLPLFYHIKFHGNLLLYYVCLLFLCPYQKNPLHALRRSGRHLRRDHCIHCPVPFLLFLKKRRFCSYRNLLLILFF